MQNHKVDIDGRTLSVSFKSFYSGFADYEVSHRGFDGGRVRVEQDTRSITMEHCTDKARRFASDYGFPWADAIAAVRVAIREDFDMQCREIVNNGSLEYAPDCVMARVKELGLATA